MPVLPGGQLRGRIIKKFTELGPYLREDKCFDNDFFFDCLSVCVSAKQAPDKREFWGWWMVVTAGEQHYSYRWQTGLFDKQGGWTLKNIPTGETVLEVESSLQKFFPRLMALMSTLDINMQPARDCTRLMVTEQSKL